MFDQVDEVQARAALMSNTRCAHYKRCTTNRILLVLVANTKEAQGAIWTGLNNIYVRHDARDVCPLCVIDSSHSYHLYRETSKKLRAVFNVFSKFLSKCATVRAINPDSLFSCWMFASKKVLTHLLQTVYLRRSVDEARSSVASFMIPVHYNISKMAIFRPP